MDHRESANASTLGSREGLSISTNYDKGLSLIGKRIKPLIDDPCQFYLLTIEIKDGAKIGNFFCFSQLSVALRARSKQAEASRLRKPLARLTTEGVTDVLSEKGA